MQRTGAREQPENDSAADRNGDLVECGVTLYSNDEDAEEIDCPKCFATVDVSRNRQRAIMSRDLLPDARILTVMSDLGESVCKL